MLQVATKTILVVEDERVVAKDIQRSLENLGYEVPITVANAEEAISSAADRCPDLVLMDIRIKGARDGIETAGILRSRFCVPVVYLTAYADSETVARAAKTEPYGYLQKPVKPSELRSAIEIALHKHQMDCQLMERERWFSTTLSSIGDGVVSTDPSGRVTYMNRAAELLIGWKAADAHHKLISEVVALCDERTNLPIEDPLARALREKQVVQLEARLIPKVGDALVIADSAAPVTDEGGKVLGAVWVFRDVSEQRKIQQQLELADRMASLGTMAAGIAHEVNNPLSFITANVDYAVDQLAKHVDAPWADEVRLALSEAQIGAQRVRTIVNDLRAFSAPIPNAPGAVDIRRVIEWALQVCGHELRARARVSTHYASAPTVRGDETRLGQVFVNLLMNAAQALPAGKLMENEVSVAISTASDGHVQVRVKDTGCGMTPEVQRRIFDPFFTTKPTGQGNGLGLAICRGILKAIGGEITVESEIGKGTTFHICLCLAPVEKPMPPAHVMEAVAAVRSKILVIDDEPVLRRLVNRILGADHDLAFPESSLEALEVLRSGERFDLIICDLMMPGISGMDLYDQLVQFAPDQAFRVAFFTGGVFTPRGADFLKSVDNAVIPKPFGPAELRARVNQLLARTRVN